MLRNLNSLLLCYYYAKCPSFALVCVFIFKNIFANYKHNDQNHHFFKLRCRWFQFSFILLRFDLLLSILTEWQRKRLKKKKEEKKTERLIFCFLVHSQMQHPEVSQGKAKFLKFHLHQSALCVEGIQGLAIASLAYYYVQKKKKRKLQSGIEVGIEHRHILEWGCLKQALSPWVTMTFFLSILNNSSILIYWHVLNWIRLDKQWPSCNPWFFIFIKYRIKHLQITNNFSVSTGRKGLILLFSLLCTYYGNSKA